MTISPYAFKVQSCFDTFTAKTSNLVKISNEYMDPKTLILKISL